MLNNYKKISLLVGGAICLTSIIGFTSCKKEEKDVEIQEIPREIAHEHEYIHHEKIDATHKTEGNIEYWSCRGCDKLFSNANDTELVGETTILAIAHSYSNEWGFDNDNHWLECTCLDKKDFAAHTFGGDGTCTECGFTHYLSFSLNVDNTSYSLVGFADNQEEILYADLVIPETYNGLPVTSVLTAAFQANQTLTSVTIPATLKTIESYAFQGCSNLKKATIPEGVTSIFKHAFQGSGLESIVLPSTLASMGDGIFGSCLSLSSATISCPFIYTELFTNCTSLVDVKITSSPSRLYGYVFHKAAFTSIMIPESITSFESTSFSKCYNLSKIYYGGASFEKWSSITRYNQGLQANATVWYYSEEKPNSDDVCNYWHYDEEGNIVEWHNTVETLSYDETGHWHNCSTCSDKIDFTEHIYTDEDKCSICGYTTILG